MNRKAKRYIYGVSIIGVLLTIASFSKYFPALFSSARVNELWILICSIFLCTVCRACPIYMKSDQTLDVSIISVLAVYLILGVDAAIATWILSAVALALIESISARKFLLSRLNFLKFLINNSSVTIAIVLSAKLCSIFNWQAGSLDFPGVLIPTFVFSAGAFIFNAVIMLTMFYCDQKMTAFEIMDTLRGLILNVLAAMPLGLLTAELFVHRSGPWFAVIMLFPLLLARYAWQLYLDAKKQQSQLIEAFISTIEARDTYTQGHSERVGHYAELIARKLRIKEKQILLIREAAVLHDVGKIGIDDYILRKPGALTPDERKKMQEHPMIGVRIVEHVGLDAEVIEMIRSHHERVDGKGYPNGITGDQMSIGVRILGVADAYDAMTSDRPYRCGMPKKQALQILIDESGKQFDGQMVKALIDALEENP